jgi:AhpD family alkylhydroperoxidase
MLLWAADGLAERRVLKLRTGINMPTMPIIEYKDASPEVREVYDDIMTTRKTDWINNFWKVLANDPVALKRTWEDIKQIMSPGALDPLTKELIYVAVSVSNQCNYCIASHTTSARKKMHERCDVQRIDVDRRDGE